jgi:hypothetical protein
MFRNEILENKVDEVFQYILLTGHIQGGSNMTGTAAAQCSLFTHKSVPVIFEPPCNKLRPIQYSQI